MPYIMDYNRLSQGLKCIRNPYQQVLVVLTELLYTQELTVGFNSISSYEPLLLIQQLFESLKHSYRPKALKGLFLPKQLFY